MDYCAIEVNIKIEKWKQPVGRILLSFIDAIPDNQ